MTGKASVPKPAQRQTPSPRPETDVASISSAASQAMPPENMTISRVMYLQSVVGNRATQQMTGGQHLQRAVNVRLLGEQKTNAYDSFDALCTATGVEAAPLFEEIKTKLSEDDLLPAQYKASLPTNSALRTELRTMINDLKPIIRNYVATASSGSTLVTEKGKVGPVAEHLYAMIRPSITPVWLNKYAYYRNSTTLSDGKGADYIRFLDFFLEKKEEYEKHLTIGGDNRKPQHRLDKFIERARTLKEDIENAISQGQGTDVTDPLMTKIKTLTEEIALFEQAWDLDWENNNIGAVLAVEGGVEDGVNVEDEYKSLLACSLYALLALKPRWLGAETPQQLHKILRRTENLKDYDEDSKVMRIRTLAGLKNLSLPRDINVAQFLAGKARERNPQNYILDPGGDAHTFAAVWKDREYKKVDNETPAGGDFGRYSTSKVLTAWSV